MARRSCLAVVLGSVAACLGPPPPLGEGSTGSSMDASTGTVTSVDSTMPGTSASSEPATGSTDATSADTAMTTTDAAESSSSSSTGGDPSVVFFDDFNRVDSNTLGNGWVEKSLDAWQILDQQVQNESAEPGFSNAFIYQPDIEVSEVEASVEFRFADVALADYPQVHGRLDPMATQMPGEVRSYGLFVDVENSDLEIIRSNPGMSGNKLAELVFGTAIENDQLYRVTITVTGDDPVQIDGALDRFEAGDWVPQATIVAMDSSPERIFNVGAVGTSGNLNIHVLSYDNFTVRDLSLEP